jgi:hypothetical protein
MANEISNSAIEMEIRNTEASLRMEGLQMSEVAWRECRLVLEGKMTDAQYMDNVRRRYAKYNNAEVLYGKV